MCGPAALGRHAAHHTRGVREPGGWERGSARLSHGDGHRPPVCLRTDVGGRQRPFPQQSPAVGNTREQKHRPCRDRMRRCSSGQGRPAGLTPPVTHTLAPSTRLPVSGTPEWANGRAELPAEFKRSMSGRFFSADEKEATGCRRPADACLSSAARIGRVGGADGVRRVDALRVDCSIRVIRCDKRLPLVGPHG